MKRALRACGITDELAVAALARLVAADALDGAGLTEQYGEAALLEAIAPAPLYRVDDSFFFDPEEVLAILRSTKRLKTLPEDAQAPTPASSVRYV